MRALLEQDELRRRALPRCPHADDLLFTREALEQATAWPVAAERGGRWPGPPDTPLFDLGAGIGLDALAAAVAGRPVVAVERDPSRVILLTHNVRALGVEGRVRILEADVLATKVSGPLAFLDPGRRPDGRRTRHAADFEPPRDTWPTILAGFAAAMIKLPPGAGGADSPNGEGADPPRPSRRSPWTVGRANDGSSSASSRRPPPGGRSASPRDTRSPGRACRGRRPGRHGRATGCSIRTRR